MDILAFVAASLFRNQCGNSAFRHIEMPTAFYPVQIFEDKLNILLVLQFSPHQLSVHLIRNQKF